MRKILHVLACATATCSLAASAAPLFQQATVSGPDQWDKSKPSGKSYKKGTKRSSQTRGKDGSSANEQRSAYQNRTDSASASSSGTHHQ